MAEQFPLDVFFEKLLEATNASKEARRGATMQHRVVLPLRRALCGASGIVTPQLLEDYAAAVGKEIGEEVNNHIVKVLEDGFKSAPALDPKLKQLIDGLTGIENGLEDPERICDQLRDAGDTFLVISKIPTKELRDRFVQRLGWTPGDADKVSFAIYKKKRPALPVTVITKTKMEAADSAVDDQDVKIDISGCGLEQDAVERFAKKLESAPLAVTSLDASANTFHKHGADAVCRMIRAAKNLRELSIAGNNMQAPGTIAAIKAVAESNPHLTRLDISNNFLTTEGAQQAGLVEAVAKTNPQLSWLGLAGNELCQAAGGDICAGLIGLGKIRTLVLNCNKLGSGGIARMAPAIKKDRCLQHLYIEANDMRDDDVFQLAEALQFHPTITSLHLKRNPLIGPLGFQSLAKLAKLNPGLVQLSYDENSPHCAQTSIAAAVEFNKVRVVHIHHTMVRDGGKSVPTDSLLLWLRMTVGSADLLEHCKAQGVTGESVWSVSGVSLEQNPKLSAAVRAEFFSTLEMLK